MPEGLPIPESYEMSAMAILRALRGRQRAISPDSARQMAPDGRYRRNATISYRIALDLPKTEDQHGRTEMDILTTTSPSGDRIQLIGLSMTDLVSLALEAALNDPQGLAGINEDTEISLEVAVADDYDGITYGKFEMGTDYEILRELNGELTVHDLTPAGDKSATVHVMIVNRQETT